MARPDPHSAFDDAQPRLQQLDWTARIDLGARILVAEARLVFDGGGEAVDLDTRDLTIDRVTDDDDVRLEVEPGAPHPFLGQRLRVLAPGGVVRIRYRTSPAAMALHWSNQSVYSQCQPLFARSMVPLPDSPSSRIRVRAALTAPRALTTLMAAAFVDRVEDGDLATTRFELTQPIAPYLLAFAVGDYVARELSPRSRVWGAPSLVDAAARALAAVEPMVAAAEAIFGPYRWERFDLLVAPSSFPYGGMENPRLAFFSPSLIAGDRTLVAVVAHELAHAWSGNLVTAASAEHFWLNEAFTVWAERRILSAVAGDEAARLHAAIGRRDLDGALRAFHAHPALTSLQLALDGVDPEEALSVVPYEKGYLLLRALEDAMGGERFSACARAYIERFAGHSITTAQFAEFVRPYVPGFDLDAWLHRPDLPPGRPPAAASPTTLPPDEELARWSGWQWRWFLDGLPRPSALCSRLDDWFNQSSQWLNQFVAGDPDVRASWLALAVASGWPPALTQLEPALAGGRIKQLRPVYLALAQQSSTKELAGRLYRKHRDGYHPIARQQLERLLRSLGVATQQVNPLRLGRRT